MKLQNQRFKNLGWVQDPLLRTTQRFKTEVTTAADDRYNAVVNHVYGSNFHTPAQVYHTETEEAWSDLSAVIDNNQNAFSKLTHANATLSGFNAMILNKMAALIKIMVKIAHQVSIMVTHNSNSRGGSGGKQNTYVCRLPLPSIYCWPHGYLKYSSQECTRKRPD